MDKTDSLRSIEYFGISKKLRHPYKLNDATILTSGASDIGKRYLLSKNDIGIVLTGNGNASDTKSIEVNNDANIPGVVSAGLYKDNKLMMTENIVGHGQKATFVLKPKLYWGIASEIEEGQLLSSAVLETDGFFEHDLDGVSEVTISLNGNAEDGYSFNIDSQS